MKNIKKLQVLVVEDDPNVLMTLRVMLNETGIDRISEATDGESARTLLDLYAKSIDVVICDWNMPNLSGIELLDYVRKKIYLFHF